jgi:hypothetical protein
MPTAFAQTQHPGAQTQTRTQTPTHALCSNAATSTATIDTIANAPPPVTASTLITASSPLEPHAIGHRHALAQREASARNWPAPLSCRFNLLITSTIERLRPAPDMLVLPRVLPREPEPFALPAVQPHSHCCAS